MFEKLSDNLNLLMAEARLNANELGKRTGLPASTIKKIRNKDNPNPTLATLLPLAQFFSISISQLVGDEALSESRIKGLYQENIAALNYIPLLSWDEVNTWVDEGKQYIKGSKSTYPLLATEYQYSPEAYALWVEEEDWENLAKGTALIIDPTLKAEHRDYIIVYKAEQKAPTLKQIFYDEGQIYLKSMIAGYHLTLLGKDHQIKGVVVEYRKNLKK